MDIATAMDYRSNLERDIKTLISDFETKTGVSVTSIDLVKDTVMGIYKPIINKVHVNVTF